MLTSDVKAQTLTVTESLVVGVDAGATSTRVAVHTLDGTRVGYARAGAGNPSAHGLGRAVGAIETALRAALPSGAGPRVVASVAGVAGLVNEVAPALAKVWDCAGIAGGPRCVGDVPIAYAAGSPEPEGALLLSGTGAVAARISDFQQVAIADGLGWLLGDAGSGFWIGRAAAKAVVAALDRGQDEGLLTELVVADFFGDERPAEPRAVAGRLVRIAQADHMRLASLARLVSRAAEEGDPTAEEITREAAGHLVATLRRVHVSGPVVLAGSVLTNEGPVRRAVLELLADETALTARDAAGAAAWLAARHLLAEDTARDLHPLFTACA